MSNFDDYHAFHSTSGGSGGVGCGGSLFLWLLVIVGILYLIGELAG